MAEHVTQGLISALLFSALGIAVFAAAFFIISKMSPLSIRKEIEVDQNVALGVLIGSIIIGLSLIISSAIHG